MKKRIIIYPEYIDSKRSRSEGRKLRKDYCVENPKIEEIYEAAKILGLNPEIQREKKYPRNWFYSKGRVIVDKNKSKLEILKEISKIIKDLRQR